MPTTAPYRALAAAAALGAALTLPAAGSPAYAAPCLRTVSINPELTAAEGAGQLVFGVHSTGCAAAGQVTYTVTAGSAGPDDFTLAGGVLAWGSGEVAVRTVAAAIVPDTVVEAALEDFTVTLTEPSRSVRLGVAAGHGRILDDDAEPGLAVDDQTCHAAPALHTVTAADPVTLCDLHQGNIILVPPWTATTVVWHTVDGTARAGVDYVAVTGRRVTIPAGTPRVELAVPLLRPAGAPARSFTVQIDPVPAGTVADGSATVTILP